MSDIDRIIREGKRSIGNTESATRERLAQRYREAFDRIERELAYVTDLLQDIDAGDLVTARGNWTRQGLAWRQQRLSGLLRLVESEYDRLAGYGVQDIAQGQRTVVRQGIRDAEQMARASNITTGFVGLNTDAYAGLTAATGPDSPVFKILQSYGPHAASVIEQGIITGAMQGWGVDRILREIRAQVPGGVPAWRLEALVRTELMRSYRGSLNTAYGQMGVQQVRWVAALQTRTCPACLAMHGTLHPVDYVMESHVNCRCVLAPYTGEAYDQPTGEEWLRGLPPDQQREVFPTQGHYDAWRDGVSLQDMTGVAKSRTWGGSVYVKPLNQLRPSAVNAVAKIPPRPTAPVSDAFQLPPEPHPMEMAAIQIRGDINVRAVSQDVVGMIDSVHRDGVLPRLPVERDFDQFSPVAGRFRFFTDGNVKDMVVTQNKKWADSVHSTIVHETGHFLDFSGIGTPGGFASYSDDLMAGWRTAAMDSNAVRALQSIPDSQYKDYILDTSEIWARSYAQYIARKTRDPRLIRDIQEGQSRAVATQWADDDFDDIERSIDDLFRGLGWID